MQRILIVFAHPRYENSQAQKQLCKSARLVPGLTFHDLYESYPDFDVNVQQEQQLMINHDIIVLQHPFYWYSCPPLLKQWLDLVLQHGWAYGKEGKALAGKKIFNAISTGGKKEAYLIGGFNRFTIAQFLAPFEQTARLCNMEYYPPFVLHGTHKATTRELEQAGEYYQIILEGLSSGRLSSADVKGLDYLNDLID